LGSADEREGEERERGAEREKERNQDSYQRKYLYASRGAARCHDPPPSLTYAPASQSRSRFRVLRPAVLWLAADNKIWRPIVQTCLFPNTQSSDKDTESPDGKPVASETPEIEYQWPVENENTSKWWHKPEC